MATWTRKTRHYKHGDGYVFYGRKLTDRKDSDGRFYARKDNDNRIYNHTDGDSRVCSGMSGDGCTQSGANRFH